MQEPLSARCSVVNGDAPNKESETVAGYLCFLTEPDEAIVHACGKYCGLTALNHGVTR